MSDTLRDTVNARRAETRNTSPAPTTTVALAAFGRPDPEQILKMVGLNPSDPRAHAVVMVCERYDLDPVLGHIGIFPRSQKPYISRDGYLHIAHRSGVFDGMDVVEEPHRDLEGRQWKCTVAIYRKDMGHAFAIPGYAELGDNNGQDMCLVRSERRGLKRAFDISTPPGTFADEDPDPESQPRTQPLTGEQLKAIQMEYKGTPKTRRLASISDIVGRRVESANELTRDEARDVLARLAEQQQDREDDTLHRTRDNPRAAGAASPRGAQPPHGTPARDAPVVTGPDGDAAGGEPGPPVPDPAAPPPATTAQRKEIVARFAQLGRTDPADVLGQITAWVGREVGSTSDLTDDEADSVLTRVGQVLNSIDHAQEPPDGTD
jgi:hypothetical protein